MPGKAVFRSLTAFAAMTAVALGTQLAFSYALPSIQVAYLDSAIFRSWTGFGIREAILQAGLLSALLNVWTMWFQKVLGQVDHITRGKLMYGAFLFGAIPMLITAFQTTRMPAIATISWGVQTTLQLAIGCQALTRLERHGKQATWRLLAGSVAVSVLIGAVGIRFPAPLPTETMVLESQDNGRIHIDVFLPPGSGPHPAVMVFHGVEGASNLVRRAVHFPNAYAIRQKGYATFFVRYFDGQPYRNLALRTPTGLDMEAVETIRLRDYRDWIATAKRAITRIRDRDDIDPDRVAVIGYSLGCYVGSAAVAELATKEFPAAFVGNFGGIWPEIELPERFPPSQFYHGEDDETIPLALALEAVNRLRAVGIACELVTYPDQGHVPDGPDGLQIRRDTERFLERTLKP